jgi:hypothetical protein
MTANVAALHTGTCRGFALVFRLASRADRKLVNRGQFDESPGNGIPVTGQDLRAALGSNIKWKPGNEPN